MIMITFLNREAEKCRHLAQVSEEKIWISAYEDILLKSPCNMPWAAVTFDE